MARYITDLQLHSRFSRAVSKRMTIAHIAMWAKRKGIGVVATGDWTHPLWFREIETTLEETGTGLLKLRDDVKKSDPPSDDPYLWHVNPSYPEPLFLLATEVSSIYKQQGRVRRVHTLIWVPSIASARAISVEMTKRGCNLMSDGRPIIGLTSIQVAELVFSIEPKALIIPAHAWTPWFSVYGSLGGFDSIADAFGPYADQIYAVETGLSSNPSMNWRIPELDTRTILSFSDAHSGPKLGREATIFDIPDGKLTYDAIYAAIAGRSSKSKVKKNAPSIAYTIEFFPEEGKYHYTGHRACNVRQTPEETVKRGTQCPVCGKQLTVGVMHRIEDLAKRSEMDLRLKTIAYPIREGCKVNMTASSAQPDRPPFVMLVPLVEIIAEALGTSVGSKKVLLAYMRLTDEVAPEFEILLTVDTSRIAYVAGERVADGVRRVREGKLSIDPGYDGVFGVVSIWDHGDNGIVDAQKEQLSLLS